LVSTPEKAFDKRRARPNSVWDREWGLGSLGAELCAHALNFMACQKEWPSTAGSLHEFDFGFSLQSTRTTHKTNFAAQQCA
jgi:hypothetical protein